MDMPFTIEQFLGVFATYNRAVWPMQVVWNLLALACIVLAIKTTSLSSNLISLVLASLWLWIGIVYHILFFTAINKAAYLFGSLFVLQGVLFIIAGVVKRSLSFRFGANAYGVVGAILVAYALLIYPILGHLLGHVYPQSPTFGLPCPTTIFTFGILLWTDSSVPKYLLGIPFLWSLVGFSAAATLGVREDFGLVVAGLAATAMLVYRDRQRATKLSGV